MSAHDHLPLLPAWVRGDVSESDDQALTRAAEADPQLDQLATALRRTQTRAAEVLLMPVPERPAARAPAPIETPADEPGAPPLRSRPGPNALYVALAAGLLAIVLGVAVITALLARPEVTVLPPVTEQLGLVVDGSLAPLARSNPEDASQSLLALGVPQPAAVPPDLTPLGLAFVSATALPGPVPGAAFEYERGEDRFLLQTAERLTSAPGSEIVPVDGVPVSWIRSQGRWYAKWQQGGVDRALTGTVDREGMESTISGILSLP